MSSHPQYLPQELISFFIKLYNTFWCFFLFSEGAGYGRRPSYVSVDSMRMQKFPTVSRITAFHIHLFLKYEYLYVVSVMLHYFRLIWIRNLNSMNISGFLWVWWTWKEETLHPVLSLDPPLLCDHRLCVLHSKNVSKKQRQSSPQATVTWPSWGRTQVKVCLILDVLDTVGIPST